MEYIPSPVIKILIPKNEIGEYRGVYNPASSDKEYQRKVLLPILDSFIEPNLSNNTFAYRRGISIVDVVNTLEDLVSKGYKWLVKLDITKYFDSIDREILFEDLRLLIPEDCVADVKRHLEVPYRYKGKLHYLKIGLYQGMPISSTLSNLYLKELDDTFRGQGKVFSLRYCDDILLISTSKAKLQKAFSRLKKILRGKKLRCKATDITDMEKEETTFLGLRFKVISGKLILKASRRAEIKLIEILKEVITTEELRSAVYSRVWYYTVGFRYMDYFKVAMDLVVSSKGSDVWDECIKHKNRITDQAFMYKEDM